MCCQLGPLTFFFVESGLVSLHRRRPIVCSLLNIFLLVPKLPFPRGAGSLSSSMIVRPMKGFFLSLSIRVVFRILHIWVFLPFFFPLTGPFRCDRSSSSVRDFPPTTPLLLAKLFSGFVTSFLSLVFPQAEGPGGLYSPGLASIPRCSCAQRRTVVVLFQGTLASSPAFFSEACGPRPPSRSENARSSWWRRRRESSPLSGEGDITAPFSSVRLIDLPFAATASRSPQRTPVSREPPVFAPDQVGDWFSLSMRTFAAFFFFFYVKGTLNLFFGGFWVCTDLSLHLRRFPVPPLPLRDVLFSFVSTWSRSPCSTGPNEWARFRLPPLYRNTLFGSFHLFLGRPLTEINYIFLP